MIDTLLNAVQSNPIIAVFAVFFAGILSAASPCVMAVMPMVVGYVGGQGASRRDAARYSLLFALGLSLTFTALGAIAGIFGRLMGDVGTFWYWVLALLIIAMGFSMMGFFDVRMPFPKNIQPQKRGAIGAFLLGLLVGIVSSPCATPVLVVLLGYVATKGQVLYGILLLFVYSIAHCSLLILAGMFTGLAQSIAEKKGLLKSTEILKKISGALVVFVGIYVLFKVL